VSPNAAAASARHRPPRPRSSLRLPLLPRLGRRPKEGESKLTVGPNIKLKGVEITDCDTWWWKAR
jgi:hypothetical protein